MARTLVCPEHISKIDFGKGTASAAPSDVGNDVALAAEGRQVGSREAFLKHTLDNVDRLGPFLNRCADV